MTSVADPSGRTRLLNTMCVTCIFRPGNLMHLRPGRLADLVATARRRDGFIVCHSTLRPAAPPGFRPAVCRGFYDRYSTAALQIAERLWGFLAVDAPSTQEGPR